MSRRRGFTFIEVLVVMIVMSILATIAVLKYIDLKHRALSSSATADLQVHFVDRDETLEFLGESARFEDGVAGHRGVRVARPRYPGAGVRVRIGLVRAC